MGQRQPSGHVSKDFLRSLLMDCKVILMPYDENVILYRPLFTFIYCNYPICLSICFVPYTVVVFLHHIFCFLNFDHIHFCPPSIFYANSNY